MLEITWRRWGSSSTQGCAGWCAHQHITRTESHVFVSNETAQDTSANEDFQIKTKPTKVSWPHWLMFSKILLCHAACLATSSHISEHPQAPSLSAQPCPRGLAGDSHCYPLDIWRVCWGSSSSRCPSSKAAHVPEQEITYLHLNRLSHPLKPTSTRWK